MRLAFHTQCSACFAELDVVSIPLLLEFPGLPPVVGLLGRIELGHGLVVALKGAYAPFHVLLHLRDFELELLVFGLELATQALPTATLGRRRCFSRRRKRRGAAQIEVTRLGGKEPNEAAEEDWA